MIEESSLRSIKSLIGEFRSEMKSNNVTDFMSWIESKIIYITELNKREKEERNRLRQFRGD